MVSPCVKLMLRTFELWVLVFDCFVYHQNVTCLKCFTKYGEVEDIIIGRLALCQKLQRLFAV